MSSIISSFLIASSALLSHEALLQSQGEGVNVPSKSFESAATGLSKGCIRCRGSSGSAGPTGLSGVTGPTGLLGPTGPTGLQGLGAETVFFSMSLGVVPTFDFAFFYSSNNSANPFDSSTTNPAPPNYTSTFLVPFDGNLSNLTVRLDFRSLENISPAFTFTAYASGSTIGSSAPIANWVSTGLLISTGPLPISAGSSLTASFQNLVDTVPVTAGSLVTVVITPSGYNMFDIQPGTFSTSLRYSPNN